MTTVTTAAAAPLTAVDRCDRCGAQAYVRVTLGSSDLLFCAHHFRENESRLRAVASAVQDETQRLAAVPSGVSVDD